MPKPPRVSMVKKVVKKVDRKNYGPPPGLAKLAMDALVAARSKWL